MKDYFIEYYNNPTKELRNKIAIDNYGLVNKMYKKIYNPSYNEKEELKQECFIWLLYAIEHYNPYLGYEFSSYACKCILKATRRRLDYKKDISIYEPIKTNDNENLEIVDTIEDVSSDVENIVFNKELKILVRKVLNDEEYNIIYLRYVKNKTLKDIGYTIGKSKGQVKRILFYSVSKLKTSQQLEAWNNLEEISYIKAVDYSKPWIKNNKINSPTETIAILKEKQEEDSIRNIFR